MWKTKNNITKEDINYLTSSVEQLKDDVQGEKKHGKWSYVKCRQGGLMDRIYDIESRLNSFISIMKYSGDPYSPIQSTSISVEEVINAILDHIDMKPCVVDEKKRVKLIPKDDNNNEKISRS